MPLISLKAENTQGPYQRDPECIGKAEFGSGDGNRRIAPRRSSSQILTNLLRQRKGPRGSPWVLSFSRGEKLAGRDHRIARPTRSPHESTDLHSPCTPWRCTGCTPLANIRRLVRRRHSAWTQRTGWVSNAPVKRSRLGQHRRQGGKFPNPSNVDSTLVVERRHEENHSLAGP